MDLLITGISGFLGFNAANILKDRYKVAGVTGVSSTGFTMAGVRIYDAGKLGEIAEEPAVVLMCHAAISAGSTKTANPDLYEANVKFTEEVVNIFPAAYHLYISTVAVYGSSNNVMAEDSPVNPASEYALSKLWGEKISSAASNNGILRLSSLYGKGMKENTIIPLYVNQALQKGLIEVWGKGDRTQNYLHINDAVGYIIQMLEMRSNGLYLGLSDKQTSNIELARLIASYTDAEVLLNGEDKTFNPVFINDKTKGFLQINSGTKLSDGIKEYIDWKKR